MTLIEIARHTVRRLLRNRLLLISAAVALGIVALMTSIAGSPMIRIGTGSSRSFAPDTSEMSLGFIAAFASLAALIIGTTVTRSDIREGTIISILAKPVRRSEYLLGSFFGALFYLLLAWGIMASVWFGLSLAAGPRTTPFPLVSLVGHVVLSSLLLCIAFCLAQQFSAWVAGALAVAIYNGDGIIRGIIAIARFRDAGISPWLGTLLAAPFPGVNRLESVFMTSSRAELQPLELGWTFLHLVDYGLVMLLIAWFLFRHQDLVRTTE